MTGRNDTVVLAALANTVSNHPDEEDVVRETPLLTVDMSEFVFSLLALVVVVVAVAVVVVSFSLSIVGGSFMLLGFRL